MGSSHLKHLSCPNQILIRMSTHSVKPNWNGVLVVEGASGQYVFHKVSNRFVRLVVKGSKMDMLIKQRSKLNTVNVGGAHRGH